MNNVSSIGGGTDGVSRPEGEREEHRQTFVVHAAVGGDRAAQSLSSAYEGEHNAHDDDDDRHPKKQVSPAHGGAGHAAESQQRRHQGDDNQDKRIIDEVSGHSMRPPGVDGVSASSPCERA